MNRRDFLQRTALAAGGLTVSVALPWVAEVGAAEPLLAELADWTIDDMWGVYPRYAEPIGYARPETPRIVSAAAAAAGARHAHFYA